MRTVISMVVAVVLFIFVAYLVYSGNIVLPEYWTQLAVTITAMALGVLYWGFKPLIDRFLKGKSEHQIIDAEVAPSTEVKQGKPLLPDKTQITRLSINSKLLDQIYEQSHLRAIDIYYDARLSCFTIQVYPHHSALGPSVNIYLEFYSKLADKSCKFAYYDYSGRLEHLSPDKHPIANLYRKTFTTLPWKESPQWMEFLDRVYAKIKPLPLHSGTGYHLSSNPDEEMGWHIRFEDGFSGNEYSFRWNGKGLDENNIKKVD